MNSLKSFVRSMAQDRPLEDSKVSTDKGSLEGFLCPTCMCSLGSPEALQLHFLSSHQKENESSDEFKEAGKPENHKSLEIRREFEELKELYERVESKAKENTEIFTLENLDYLSFLKSKNDQFLQISNDDESKESKNEMMIKEISTLLDEQRAKNQILQEQYNSLSNEIKTLQDSHRDLQSRENDVEVIQKENNVLKEEKKNLQTFVDSLQLQLSSFEKERVHYLMNTVVINDEDTKKMMRQLIEEKQNLVNDLASEKDKNAEGKKQNDFLSEKLLQLEKVNHERKQNEKDQITSLKTSLEANENKFKTERQSYEKKIWDLERDSEEKRKSIATLQNRICEFEKSIQNISISKMTSENDFQQREQEHQKSNRILENKLKELGESEKGLKDINDELRVENENLENKILSLYKQLEDWEDKYNEKTREVEIGKEFHMRTINKLESELKAMNLEFTSVKEERESLKLSYKTYIDSYTKEIDELKSKTSKDQEEFECRRQILEASVDKYKFQLIHESSLREKMEEENKSLSLSRENLNFECNEALSKKLELEAALEVASDEKILLMERCLNSENELEKTRHSIMDLRRKLDDSQAGLRELGRENQSIQMELNKFNERKWANDSEVSTCVGCSNSFSLTLRKHHCRNCGQIFCGDCSSKTAVLLNSKKPQRVCENCFSELVHK